MAIDLKLIDKLLLDYKKPEDIIGENGLLKQLDQSCFGARHASRDDRALGL
jgi:putative transposase